MYGLPQVGILAHKLLEQRLNKHGYHQSSITPGLWRHDYQPISFTLCVDNFDIKYVGREHAEHLASILSKQVLTQLGRTTVPHHDHRLGLHRMSGPCLHARLHPRSTHTLSTSNSLHPSASTVPPCQTNLRRKSPIHGRRGLIPASRQTGQKIRPRGHRHVALLRTLC